MRPPGLARGSSGRAAGPWRPSLDAILCPVDAVTDLPAGLVAAVVTHLEMRARPEEPSPPPPEGVALERLRGADVDRYLAIYRAVGAPWLWFSRLQLERASLVALLDDPGVEACAVTQAGADIGLVELDGRAAQETELVFFGLVESRTGRGLGGALLRGAIARAFDRPIGRLTVHTCTLDHPRALATYRKAGFSPYKRSVEIARDPRHTGLLRCEDDAHVPLIP